MSKIQDISIKKANSAVTLFLFFAGVIVSFVTLSFSIEIFLKDSPAELIDTVKEYQTEYASLGIYKDYLQIITLKFQLYKAVLNEYWTLWAVPITILSLTMVVIMGIHRRVMVHGFVERISQNRRVLSQERNRKKTALVQLEKSEDHLYNIHEQLTEAFFVVNKGERFHHLNRTAVQLLSKWNNTPKSSRHYAEQPVETFIQDYHSSGLGLCVSDAISKGLSWQKELYFDKNDMWLQVRVYPTGDDSAYVYMRDISNEKKPDHLKRVAEDMVKSIAETSPYPIAILDRQWNYLVVSKEWKESFFLQDEELIGKSHKAVMPRLPGKWQAVEGQLLEGKTVKSESMVFQLNGKDEHVNWEISPWEVAGEIHGFMMYASIVTEIQHDKEKLEQQREREHQLAYHDILTGLPNRQLFYDRLTMGLAHAYRGLGKVALFFLDLDGFKAINDNLGHDIGDMLLKEVGIRLKQCVRDTDTVARLGGDEFTVILNGVASEEDAAHVADKIIKSINNVFLLGEHEVYMSTSIGISLYPLDGSTSAELIKKSDTAMYWSKEAGKNQATFFSKDLNREGGKLILEGSEEPVSKKDISDRDLESQIRTALQKEEIEAYFQPQYNYETQTIIGLEALMRWNHPVAGLLEPRKFLNIAENTGMILPMGEYVLEAVTEKADTWRKVSGEPLTFSVNFSKRQLKDENLVKRVQKALNEKKIPLEWLVVEIPESILMEGDEDIEATIKSLASIGCQVYVDDFGLSYTSLQQLEGIPLKGIKIHESLVHNALNSTEDKTAISSIITLAKNLKLNIIAEGVETEEQAAFLVEQGCSNIQGFVVGKPSKPNHISELLE